MAESAGDESTARVIAESRMMVNVVTAYESVAFRLTDTALEADWPVPILGVLPVRRVRREIPLSRVRSIRLVPVVFPSRFLVMTLLALAPAAFRFPFVVTLVAGAFALLFLLLSVVLAVEITADDGTTTIPVCALQRERARGFIDEVRAALSARSAP
jgi:hypothetical protein